MEGDLLTRADQCILVQFVLNSMLVYLAMAIELPPWALKAIDKIRRGFLWTGRKDTEAGIVWSLVTWTKVRHPPEVGVLGTSNQQNLGWTLRIRWICLQKTDLHRPWLALPVQIHGSAQAFFSMAVVSEVGVMVPPHYFGLAGASTDNVLLTLHLDCSL